MSKLPSNVKLPLSSNSPPVPARTIRPDVKSETFAELATKPPIISTPPFASIALVNVDTPEVTIIPEAKVAIPTNVEIPVTFRSVNVFGAFAIADSIVDVVTASSDAIFFN